MSHYKYLIVGAGMAAAAAVRSIRKLDAEGPIGLVGAEPDPPYARPPLSKALWKGEPLDSVWKGTDRQEGVDLHLGRRAQALDPRDKRVTDDQGAEYTYDKLLLATGGTPRRLPFGGDDIIYFRTLADYKRLRALTESSERFAVIGGGFIGSEIAAALAMNGKKVTLVLTGAGMGERFYPPDVVRFLNSYYREKGVEILTGQRAAGLEKRGSELVLKTEGGQEIAAEGIVAGIGIEPNVELARQAGLTLDNGVVVDELLRTSAPDVYAAGDIAFYPDAALGERRRVEHEDNANAMGRFAGRIMAGEEKPYTYLPFFYSDLFDLGYEAVGDLDSRLEIVSDWKEPYQEGVSYYLRDGRVRGVLLWNVWEQVKAARRLIAEPGPFRPEDLKGRLPEAGSG
jgi:NADPH-dependent 2,4-dienoyl-CoA reductase/sulfur reductase-like enzyme